jgi:hypothetical protein
MTPPAAPEFKSPAGPTKDGTEGAGTHRRAAASTAYKVRQAAEATRHTTAPAPAILTQESDALAADDGSVSVAEKEREESSTAFIAEGEGHRREFGWVNLDDMIIDPRMQRPQNVAEVNAIARQFDPVALGTVTLSARIGPDGNTVYVIIDGQQRRAGALKAGFNGKVRADVHHNLTRRDEAKLFRLLNYRKSVQPIDLFRIALIEEDPGALAVQKILDDLDIQFGTSRGYSGATSSRRLVARNNGAFILRWALEQTKRIYGNDTSGSAYDAKVVEAFYWLYDHHGTRIDVDNLYVKLAKNGGGTADLVGHAKTIKSVRGGRIGVNLIRAIIARYNTQLRSTRTRLPDWTLDATAAAAVEEIDSD